MACMTPAARRHAHLDRRPGGARVPRERHRMADGEPPARLPGLRRGRRMPPAGHDGDDRSRLSPLPLHQAHLPEPGPGPVRQPRDEPLHPVLPLRALLSRLCRRPRFRCLRLRTTTSTSVAHEDGMLENEFSGNLVEVCPTGVFTDKTLQAALHAQVGSADARRRSACTAASAATPSRASATACCGASATGTTARSTAISSATAAATATSSSTATGASAARSSDGEPAGTRRRGSATERVLRRQPARAAARG